MIARNDKSYKMLRLNQGEIDNKYQMGRGLVKGVDVQYGSEIHGEGAAIIKHRVAVIEEKRKLFSTITHNIRPRNLNKRNYNQRLNKTFMAQERYEDMKNAHSFI